MCNIMYVGEESDSVDEGTRASQAIIGSPCNLAYFQEDSESKGEDYEGQGEQGAKFDNNLLEKTSHIITSQSALQEECRDSKDVSLEKTDNSTEKNRHQTKKKESTKMDG